MQDRTKFCIVKFRIVKKVRVYETKVIRSNIFAKLHDFI